MLQQLWPGLRMTLMFTILTGLIYPLLTTGLCQALFYNQANGSLIAMNVLERLGMPYDEIAQVMGAVGNHEEERGEPVGPISAAIIIADKADVHKSRVQNAKPETFDTHDQVNNASTRSFVRVDAEKNVILMEIDIDTSVSQVGDFFEIYVSRLLIARRAAKFLGCEYHLVVNGARVY